MSQPRRQQSSCGRRGWRQAGQCHAVAPGLAPSDGSRQRARPRRCQPGHSKKMKSADFLYAALRTTFSGTVTNGSCGTASPGHCPCSSSSRLRSSSLRTNTAVEKEKSCL